MARIEAEPELKARLLREMQAFSSDPVVMGFMNPERVYLLGDPPDYEPGPDRSVSGIARAKGQDPWATFIDLLLADGGRELLNSPVLNYTDGNLDAVGEMLRHPTSAFGLGDGGAHAGQTCDASTTTYLLSYWARDRDHGRLPVELAVQKLTSATASLYGLGDRGLLAPGMVGDVNVIDFEQPAACTVPRRWPTSPAVPRGCCSGPTATCRPSSPAPSPSSRASTPAPCPARCCVVADERRPHRGRRGLLGRPLRP